MNYFITSILSLFIVFNVLLSIPFKQVEEAFSRGDASRIIALGTPKMIISIEGTEGIYSKPQGTQVLNNFFRSNPPKNFKYEFKGNFDSATDFVIASYQSRKKYRITIKFKEINSNYLIESLTIVAVAD